MATDVTSELILDPRDVAAPGSDGADWMPTIERVEAQAGVAAERLIAGGAHGSGDSRAGRANQPEHSIDLVSPVRWLLDPEFQESAFEVDPEHKRATRPPGHTAKGKGEPNNPLQRRQMVLWRV